MTKRVRFRNEKSDKPKRRGGFGQVKPDGRDLGGAQVIGTPPGAMVRQQISQKGYNAPGFITSPDGSWTTINDGLAQQTHTQITRSGKFAKSQTKNTFRDPMSQYYEAPKGTKQNKKNKKMPWESF